MIFLSRNRKPLSEQTKNLTISEKENLKQGEEHSKTLSAGSIKKSPPKWLQGDTARKEYRHLVRLLSENEFLGEIDSNNLAIYCNAFGKYIELEEEYQNTHQIKYIISLTKIILYTENGGEFHFKNYEDNGWYYLDNSEINSAIKASDVGSPFLLFYQKMK